MQYFSSSRREAVKYLASGCLTRLRAVWGSSCCCQLARHESYIAKIFCTELGFRVADRCMQIHGGMGLTTELPIHKMWKDSRSSMITEGAVEVMRMVLARETLRLFGS